MAIILLVLLLALILGGLGFAIHILWWIALIVLVIWLIGFAVRVGEADRGVAGTAGYRAAAASPRWPARPACAVRAGFRKGGKGLANRVRHRQPVGEARYP